MPDWGLYLQAFVTCAATSAVFVLVSGRLLQPTTDVQVHATCVLGFGFGLITGYFLLRFSFVWPPANGIERFLEIVLPATLAIELAAGHPRISPRLARFLRLGLAAVVGRILLHDSVYLIDHEPVWTRLESLATLVGLGLLLATTWALLASLAQRSSEISIGLALGMATLCAGTIVMLAGYLKGGAAALPLCAAIVATTIATRSIANRPSGQSAIGVGVVGLFGLLFIGRFYGGLRSTSTLLTFLAPLLCWATEIRQLRERNRWLLGAIRLALVAIPLVVVLLLAKRDFDRDFVPLLMSDGGTGFQAVNTLRSNDDSLGDAGVEQLEVGLDDTQVIEFQHGGCE